MSGGVGAEHEGGLIRCAGRPREWSCGAVPPQERWHEGGLVFVFFLEVAPVSGGVGAGARGGFNPLRGATTGVVMRRRATSGEMARGGGVFVFSLEVAPVSGGVGAGARGGLIRCAGRPREWSCGAVPPQERWHEGGWFLFFLWRLLRCRRGILSHPRERPATHAAAGAAARGVLVFGLGDYFAVGLGAVAGAWVDHRSGQTRMPPQSDGTRGFWF